MVLADGTQAQVSNYVPELQAPPKTPDQLWEERSQLLQLDNKARDAYHGAPRIPCAPGRSIHVSGGEVAVAYRRLQAVLRRNNVMFELRRNERHERKGDKRRRLSSQRWRKRFAHEVRTRSHCTVHCS
jgi:small subunit ribosomal protein MRP21